MYRALLSLAEVPEVPQKYRFLFTISTKLCYVTEESDHFS
jgi:hypothetical protein